MNILVVAAHPDDEVLGCGGTIPRMAEEGHNVFIAILGEGITSRHRSPQEADRAAVEALHAQTNQVSQLLRAKELFMHNLPDNRFDTVPLIDVVKTIEDLIHRLKPRVVYTHHAGDLNIDHATVSRAVLTATRPLAEATVKELYAFEVPSSTEWAFHQLVPPFHPNVFVDITQTLEIKIDAMRIYADEMRPFPHPRSAGALRAIAQRWGSVTGLPAAEAFQLIRWIR